jgi:hypothetical protein
VIPDAAVESGARAMLAAGNYACPWESLPVFMQANFTRDARAALEAAAPHMLAAKVAEARVNNDHIIEGGGGYSAGFYYALHCIEGAK